MKSGDPTLSRNDDYSRGEFVRLRGHPFTQRTFHPQPALLAREPVNGHRLWQNYHGGPFDATQFELVEAMWDHEHCAVCFFSIQDGHTFWSDEGGVTLLCDACHDALATPV